MDVWDLLSRCYLPICTFSQAGTARQHDATAKHWLLEEASGRAALSEHSMLKPKWDLTIMSSGLLLGRTNTMDKIFTNIILRYM